jgi:hypothetical protein
MGLPPLRNRWFGHCPKEDCHGDNILGHPGEKRWMITAVVVADAAVDVASSTLSRATIIATPKLLLERRTQLCQPLLLLLKLSLKLLDFL